ncbi:hypothetical protein H0H81_005198 [Sphagnurus paluster]|uniref:Uncharacterized protein n=1 Tax=Sphagnurus paluster TaxID=117069 RepID=A0A9P7FU24_9AGAR|nr:hypothetical protein H0H81_005198 [Sphagnurus paluster]
MSDYAYSLHGQQFFHPSPDYSHRGSPKHTCDNSSASYGSRDSSFSPSDGSHTSSEERSFSDTSYSSSESTSSNSTLASPPPVMFNFALDSSPENARKDCVFIKLSMSPDPQTVLSPDLSAQLEVNSAPSPMKSGLVFTYDNSVPPSPISGSPVVLADILKSATSISTLDAPQGLFCPSLALGLASAFPGGPDDQYLKTFDTPGPSPTIPQAMELLSAPVTTSTPPTTTAPVDFVISFSGSGTTLVASPSASPVPTPAEYAHTPFKRTALGTSRSLNVVTVTPSVMTSFRQKPLGPWAASAKTRSSKANKENVKPLPRRF